MCNLRVGLCESLSGLLCGPHSPCGRRLLAFRAVSGCVCISLPSSGFAIMPQCLPVTAQKELVHVNTKEIVAPLLYFREKRNNYPLSIALRFAHCQGFLRSSSTRFITS